MQHHEFMAHFDRLKENWGKNNFSPEKVAIIWKAVRDLEVEWFSRLVDRMVATVRQAPMPVDFMEAAMREKKVAFDHETQLAAERWDSGNFNGLSKYLDSIGAKDLNHAVAIEKQRIAGEDATLRT